MAADSFEFDYPPGFTKPTHQYGDTFGDEFHAPRVRELLASTAGYTQFGVTLAGGQGIVPTGCVIAQKTSDKKYRVYSSGASDGTQNAVGVLRDARDTGGTGSVLAARDQQGNIVVKGVVFLDLLSGTDTTSLVTAAAGGFGSGASGAVTQLKGRVDGVNSLFFF